MTGTCPSNEATTMALPLQQAEHADSTHTLGAGHTARLYPACGVQGEKWAGRRRERRREEKVGNERDRERNRLLGKCFWLSPCDPF